MAKDGTPMARCDQLMAGRYVDVDGIDEVLQRRVSARIAPVPGTLPGPPLRDTDRSEW